MKIKKPALLLILSFLFFNSLVYAQTVGNDLPYRVREQGNYRFIYSTEYEQLANHIVDKNSFFTKLYEKEYSWVLDEDTVLALASSKNQITNGFATQFPRLWTLFYNGGPAVIDEFGASSWAEVLLSHETVHLYQLNTRRGLSTYMKKILGGPANPLGIGLPFTYIITPHVFTPTFMIEGNAMFNEGRFGNGGRLYSAYYRAMFLQLLKKQKLTASRVINDDLNWPFGTENYVVGGYFNSFLAEKFGTSRVNRYFYVHAEKYFWPFLMSNSFRDNYGEDFYSLLEKFKSHYQPLADNQKELNGDAITKSFRHNTFTSNGDVISFMTTKSQGLNQLCLFHKIKKKLKCEQTLLPFGRLFRHNKQWVSSAYQKTHPTEIRAGLFYDGYKRIDEFNDQYVYAKKGPHLVYADALNSFHKTRVFKNGKFIDEMQSSPYMDNKGNLFYFKQDGGKRWLYRNGRQQFSIKGYYGRVVDISSNGTLFFTGATRSGTGLFSWDGRQMYQVLDSDRVFDAKLLNEREALVAEVTSEGVETRVARFEAQVGEPVLYDYEYDDPTLKTAFDESKAPATEALDYEYSPLLEMEYNGVTPTFGYINPDGFLWNLNFQFNDPLQKYSSNLILADSGFESYSAQWLLQSQAHRLQWTLSALYDIDTYTKSTGPNLDDVEIIGRTGEVDFDMMLRYPLLQTPLWKSGVSLGYSYESIFALEEEPGVDFGRGYYLNAGVFIYDLSYGFQNSLDFEASRFVGLELGYKYEGKGGSWENATPAYTAEVKTQWDLLWQSFLSASYKAAKSDGPRRSIELDQASSAITFDPTDFFRFEDDHPFPTYLELHKVNAEFKQAFMVRQYFSKLFVGLHRVAPFYGYSEFYGNRDRGGSLDTLFHESYYGVEFEILLFHKITTRLKALEVESSLGLRRQEWIFSASKSF